MRESKKRVIAGHHAIRELIQQRPRSIRGAWFVSQWESNADLREIHKLLAPTKLKIEVKPSGLLEKECHSHQGVLLFADTLPEYDLAQLKDLSHGVVLLLDRLEDPHNLGAVLRTSWLLGVKAILIPLFVSGA